MKPMIDSHQHFWDRSKTEFDYSWQESNELGKICRSFLPADLQPLCEASGVTGTVFVQTQHNLEENRWALQLAEENDWIVGVVGWVDLASERCESQLLEFKGHPKFVGIRHVIQDEPDPDFVLREDITRGLETLQKHDVSFDLLFYNFHLKHAATVAGKLPNLRLVINHLAKPFIVKGELELWRRDLAKAAQFDNVYCKLSGLITEADWQSWQPSDLQPYVDTAIELFGPSRCMFGSDWPVCQLAGSYQQVIEAMRSCINHLSEAEQAQIMEKTAREFYRLT